MLDGKISNIIGLVSDYILKELLEDMMDVIFLKILLYLFAELDLLLSIHKL